jgi:hypothetical protein
MTRQLSCVIASLIILACQGTVNRSIMGWEPDDEGGHVLSVQRAILIPAPGQTGAGAKISPSSSKPLCRWSDSVGKTVTRIIRVRVWGVRKRSKGVGGKRACGCVMKVARLRMRITKLFSVMALFGKARSLFKPQGQSAAISVRGTHFAIPLTTSVNRRHCRSNCHLQHVTNLNQHVFTLPLGSC